MARGNRRERIFRDESDHRFFLAALAEACGRTGWRVHAWTLMSNHYHFLLETPDANLVAGMQWLQNTYTRRFNTRHGLWGRLFGDRYKAVLTEGRRGDYYCALLDYIHLNSVRAGLINVQNGESVLDFPWSSVAGGYALPARRRPPWLAGDVGLEAFGYKDDANGRRRFVERLDARALEEKQKACGVPAAPEDARQSNMRRGWYWGSQAFAERMLELGEATLGRKRHRSARSSGESRAHDEKTAQRLLAEGQAIAGLSDEDLKRLPGSDARKIAIARVIWEKTTIGMAWLAEHLHLRSAANASQQILRARRAPRPLPPDLEKWTRLS